jgi:5-methylcytosine-specific restriction endonuclease McrA
MSRDYRGTTTERGLGNEHQKERRRLLPLAHFQPCPLCGYTMYPEQALDLDHVVPRAFGGSTEVEGGRISHASCNRAEGPRIRRALRHQWAVMGTSEIRSRRW